MTNLLHFKFKRASPSSSNISTRTYFHYRRDATCVCGVKKKFSNFRSNNEDDKMKLKIYPYRDRVISKVLTALKKKRRKKKKKKKRSTEKIRLDSISSGSMYTVNRYLRLELKSNCKIYRESHRINASSNYVSAT